MVLAGLSHLLILSIVWNFTFNRRYTFRSAANIPGVKTALVNTLNVYDILNADKFIVIEGAVAQIEEVYA